MTPHKLSRYIRLTTMIKTLEAQKEELRKTIIETPEDEIPSGYIVKCTESTRSQIESLEAIRDKSQKLFDALHSAGCVREVKSVRVSVKKG